MKTLISQNKFIVILVIGAIGVFSIVSIYGINNKETEMHIAHWIMALIWLFFIIWIASIKKDEYIEEKDTEIVVVQVEKLMELKSKQDWINKIPRHLPEKKHHNEQFLWLDKNGNVLINGGDFMAAEKLDTYPVSIYRTIKVKDLIK